eukprot:GILJ01013134.1.p1 GENE.GILJ01013134.1~~GILJ01013134.1.p1  ORF type:complete len:416 (-),score=27.10 GILJ01013134.1:131-1378(-)
MSISSHTADRGSYKRATSLRLAPYARLRGCGHCTCYPCAVAYGITERLGSKSTAVCPCCLKESFVEQFKTAEQDNLLEGDDNAFSCSQASGSPLSPIYQQQPDAAIEQLRERYRALRETEAQRAAQRLRLTSMAPPILSPPIGKSEDEPTSILRRSDFRTPSRCGVSRCASLIRTPSTEPMGVTPVPNTPPTIPSRARSISPSVSFKWGAGSFHLDQPITPASARTAKSSFLKGSRLCQAKPKSFQSAFDLIFLSNMHPNNFQQQNSCDDDDDDARCNSMVDEDSRSAVVVTPSSTLCLSSPRREMSRDSKGPARRLAHTHTMLWLGGLRGDGPSPSLCTSARSHRSINSARSEFSMDLPMLVARSISDRCELDGCEDSAVAVVVRPIDELQLLSDVPLPSFNLPTPPPRLRATT